MNVNGSCLNVSVLRPTPLQAVAEVFMQDGGAGVVIVEYLRDGGAVVTAVVSDFLLLINIISEIYYMCIK